MARQYLSPDDIYRESFGIIRRDFGEFWQNTPEMEVFKRIAHATADVEFAKTFTVMAEAVERGVEAIRSGKNIVTDAKMVQAGIYYSQLQDAESRIHCLLYDEGVAEEAAQRGTTKTAVAIARALPLWADGGIVAIGNAPTALFEVIDLIQAGEASPALVIGVPVGYVGAAEAKQELIASGIPCISNPGRRGGSSIAATCVNALITLANSKNQLT